MAARLSENPSRTVLLLEAGPAYQPQEYPEVFLDPERIGGDAEHDWGFLAAVGPEGPLDRQIAVPRGKLLGGSSAVNAAVALRAVPGDFAAWAADGLTGWSFEEVLETYRNLESADSGDDRCHGRSGPLAIHQRTYDELTPSVRAFIDTAEQQGYRFIDDPNADQRSGVAAVPLNSAGESAWPRPSQPFLRRRYGPARRSRTTRTSGAPSVSRSLPSSTPPPRSRWAVIKTNGPWLTARARSGAYRTCG
jgi:choline dehydrogenase